MAKLVPTDPPNDRWNTAKNAFGHMETWQRDDAACTSHPDYRNPESEDEEENEEEEELT